MTIEFFSQELFQLFAFKPAAPPLFVPFLVLFPPIRAKGLLLHLKTQPASWALNHDHFPPSQGTYTFYFFMLLYIQHTLSTSFFPIKVKLVPIAFVLNGKRDSNFSQFHKPLLLSITHPVSSKSLFITPFFD